MSLDDLISSGGGRKGKGKGSKRGGGKGSKGGREERNGKRVEGGSKEAKLDMELDDLVGNDRSDRGKGKSRGKGKGKSKDWDDWKGSDSWGGSSRSEWGRGGPKDDWGGSWREREPPRWRDSPRDEWRDRDEPERWGRRDGGRDGGDRRDDRDARGSFSWGGDRDARGGRDERDSWGRGTKRGRDDGDHRSTRSKVIKVTNIPTDLGKEDIQEAFEAETGKILSCDMKRGTAIIRFARAEDALKAAETFDRGELNGRIIQVTVEQGY